MMSRLLTTVLVVALSLSGFALAQAGQSTPNPSINPSVGAVNQGQATTPLQQALQQSLQQRAMEGLPTPAVTFEANTIEQAAIPTDAFAPDSEPIRMTGRTTIEFSGPQEAGYDRWPAPVVTADLPEGAQGYVNAGDYSESVRVHLAEKLPGIWDRYQYGQEPRTYVFEETIEIETAADPSAPVAKAVSHGDILLGFTNTIIYQDEISVQGSVCTDVPLVGHVCVDFASARAWYSFQVAVGLRLPLRVEVVSPDEMQTGNTYQLASRILGLDWNAEQYRAAGAPPEDGHEYVQRYAMSLGAYAEILDYTIFDWSYSTGDNRSQSFVTPFGPNASFPLSEITLGDWSWDLLPGVAFFTTKLWVTPTLGSTDIRATWQAVAGSDAFGAGAVAYSDPDVVEPVGPVTACDLGPGTTAQIQVRDFRYWFNLFLLQLRSRVEFHVFNWTPGSAEFDIARFDLGGVTGNLSLGVHPGTTGQFTAQVPVIDAMPPTTESYLAGVAGTAPWYRSNVGITLTAVDTWCGSGVGATQYSLDGQTWLTYAGPFELQTEGANQIRYRSIDHAGNVESVVLQTVHIDKTPPLISGSRSPGPNGYGWNNEDVTVHFACSDATSGVAFCSVDVVLGSEGADQSVVGTAIDQAGNSAASAVSGIHIDKTPPQVTITSPTAAAFLHTATLHLSWSTQEELSGIAMVLALLDGNPVNNGQAVDLLSLSLGQHSLEVNAVDKAGNLDHEVLAFSVIADIYSLIGAKDHACAQNWIDKLGICRSLGAKLNAAKFAIERSQFTAARHQLQAFLNHLQAQNGQAVNKQAYDLLRGDALYVMNHLP